MPGSAAASARTAEGLDGTDIADLAHERLAGDVRTIHVVGRSAPDAAKFDPVMVRELAGLPGIRHVLHGIEALPDDGKDARIDAVRALAAADPGIEHMRMEWWFGLTPLRIEARDAGAVVTFVGVDGEVALRADDVITAVGFCADPDGLVEPATTTDGRIEAGLYVAGWLRRGPRGTIPDQRIDARALARTISEDVAAGAVGTSASGRADDGHEIDFDGWRRIDLRERLGAAPGRERAKLPTRDAQIEAAGDLDLALPDDDSTSTTSLGRTRPLTILFGTESGGAELVAEELRRALGEDADIEVADLADARPTALDRARTHVVVCSTYGDGEVPTAARPFHEELANLRPDLAGLTYAVFGMGDRSYTKTYSRGSELIDEALAACGASRVGEYGRHDAGGPIPAAEAAVEWLRGVLAEADALVA